MVEEDGSEFSLPHKPRFLEDISEGEQKKTAQKSIWSQRSCPSGNHVWLGTCLSQTLEMKLVMLPVASAITASVTLRSYPGTTTSVRGFLRIDSDEAKEQLIITGTATGLEAEVNGGIHIHSGFSCDDADLVEGHYFEGAEDPWLVTTYDTDAKGLSAISLVVSGFTMSGRLPVADRALVLHAADGSRVACGIVTPTSGQFVSFSVYPGYTGLYDTPVGTLLVEDLGSSSISIQGTVAGFESSVSGGLHIHEGFNCDNAGGHYFIGTDDPWLLTTYTTGSDGVGSNVSLTVAPYTLHSEYPVAHRAVVLHESDGTRVACGVLGAPVELAEVASTSSSKSQVKAGVMLGDYPGTTSSGVRGFLRIDSDEAMERLTITGTVSGLEASVNGAGIHIHSGFSCDDADLVEGHYYEGLVDPWLVTTYDTDASGLALISLEVDGYSLLGQRFPVADRAVVLHAADGSRVACGIVEPTSGEFLSLATYPGYTGSSSPVGTLLVADLGSSSISISGYVAGLEGSVSGGLHVHEGFNCDNAGGHYFLGSDDPWLTTMYTTGSDGAGNVSLTVAPYTLRAESPIAYRAIVLHEADGTRVACGIIGAAASMVMSETMAPTTMVVETTEPTTQTFSKKKKVNRSNVSVPVVVIVGVVCLAVGVCLALCLVGLWKSQETGLRPPSHARPHRTDDAIEAAKEDVEMPIIPPNKI